MFLDVYAQGDFLEMLQFSGPILSIQNKNFLQKIAGMCFQEVPLTWWKRKSLEWQKTNWKRFRFRCLNNCKKIRIHKLYSSWLMTWFIRAVWARSLGWKRTIEIWPRCLSSPCLNVTCYTFEKEVIKLNGEVGLLFTNSVNDDGIKYTSSRARARHSLSGSENGK